MAFLDNARPMTPREVHEAARKHHGEIGIATVYRTLKLLCRDGWLVPVELPGEQVTYYERAQEHHHHFVCRICEQLVKVEACLPDPAELAPPGCVVEDHEFLLYGVCGECAARTAD
jgi:Fur family ferric uptake transcriptional regulator